MSVENVTMVEISVENDERFFRFVGAFAILRNVLASCLSVLQHETTGLPLDRFLWDLVLGNIFVVYRL